MLNQEARREKRKQRKLEEKGMWKKYFRLLFKAKLPWVMLIILIILDLGYSTILLQFPQYVQKITAGDISNEVIFGVVAVSVGGVLVYGIVGYYRRIVMAKIDVSYRNLIWQRLMKSPISLYDKVKANEMVSRAANDTATISDMLGSVLPRLISTVYSFVFILIMLKSYDWRLVACLVLFAPIYIGVNIWYGKWYYRANKQTQNRLAQVTQFLSELLMNVPLIKSFNTEKKEERRGKEYLHQYYKVSMKRNLIELGTSPILTALSLGLDLFVVVFGIYLVSSKSITIDIWVAFFLYTKQYMGQVGSIITIYNQTKRNQGITSRIALLVEGELEQYERKQSLTTTEQDIVFDHVDFGYEDKIVLKDISFRIPHGKRTAIIGPSGSGKSTILALIQQLYAPSSGSIRFGNEPVERFHLPEWRNMFSYVAQDSPLLNGSIRDNIVYGVNRQVSEFEIAEAAKVGDALTYIKDSPNGFDTQVGENGSNLSGGQRKRIMIAQAVLRNADILLLDEAMVGLDGSSEKAVQEALDKLMVGKTSIILTHDLSTIINADQIILLNEGKVEATGTHDQLMSSSDLYQQFVRYLTQSSVG
ncbi:ABC transporter ATP-binding protein [Brevibacillus reuszeri]|uniref:ABC transporter ATP-binding protein n=1 Tax=Brevibacillus reuszeri TaxID=54915 RepID=UPI0028A2A584|nr:ABC transporter ATP-binding protein [Brevibacillus reuszeri]